MRMIKLALATGSGLVLTAFASFSYASPIVYNFTGGYIQLTATSGSSTVVEPNTIALSGSEATFDPSTDQLTNFLFTTTGSTTVNLTGSLGLLPLTGESVTLSNVNIAPATGYASSAVSVAAGTYTFMAGPIGATGSYSFAGPIATIASTPFTGTTSSLQGLLQTSGNAFSLNGITLGTVNLTVAGATTPVTLKADIVFTGVTPVPLPAAVWLLGSGLGLLGVPLWRRRRPV